MRQTPLRVLVRSLAVLIVVLAWLAPASAAPTVTVTPLTPPPIREQLEIQDSGGIASLVVTLSENADTVVPPFVVGTTDPIDVLTTRINQLLGHHVAFQITDVAGAVFPFDFAFDVNGALVPEPTTLVLLASGLVGLGAERWRRRQRR